MTHPSGPLTAKPAGERKCLCVSWHRPPPTILHSHHVWPLGEGGPDTSENLLWLCPTTHNSVHQLWRAMVKHKGVVPTAELKSFARYTREVVTRGWAQAAEAGQVDIQ
jgi:HNH endonuclease